MSDMIKNKIKVVIWDLDDTLWRGTLAEGDAVELFEHRADIVRTLNNRGIVSAICSKNDKQTAMAKLEEFGLLEEFVFPAISFDAKGPVVKELLQDMGLRDTNALFIDDNYSNLQEVVFYNPNISVIHADSADGLLDHPMLKGKNDASRSRLQQYRILQEKTQSRKSFEDNEAFLADSQIKLEVLPYHSGMLERVVELVERTNQLNFTKNRMDQSALAALLSKDTVEAACISVSDRFGDHGVVGFYALEAGRLIHFLFSCRIMNMGIEQWVYAHLGYPELETVGEVISAVSPDMPKPAYIAQIEKPAAMESMKLSDFIAEDEKCNILINSTCDLEVSAKYLKKAGMTVLHERNFHFGQTFIINSGSQYIRNCYCLSEQKKQEINAYVSGYGHATSFKTEVFSESNSYVILSFQYDIVLEHLIDKQDPEICIPHGGNFYPDHGDADERAKREAYLAEHYDTIPALSEARFCENMEWICKKMPKQTILLLLTLPEIKADLEPAYAKYYDQIVMINRCIYAIAKKYPNTAKVIPIDRIICNKEQLSNSFFHWKPETSFLVSYEILKLMSENPSRRALSPLQNLPVGQRELLILTGRNVSTNAATLYFSLLACGVAVKGFVYSKLIPMEKKCTSFSCLGDIGIVKENQSQYYVIVADMDEGGEVLQQLQALGCEMPRDFVCDSSFVVGLDSKQVAVAQNGNRFTFRNMMSAPNIEYSWAVCHTDVYHKCLGSNPRLKSNSFTFTAAGKATYFIRAYVSNDEHYESANVAELWYNEKTGAYVLDSSYHNPVLDAEQVEDTDTYVIPCVDTRLISVFQQGDMFTFYNTYYMKDATFSYCVLNGNKKVVLHRGLCSDRSLTLNASFFNDTCLYVRAGITYRGVSKARVVAKIEYHAENRRYVLDKSYRLGILYEPIVQDEVQTSAECFGKDVFIAKSGNKFTFLNHYRGTEKVEYAWFLCDQDAAQLCRTNFTDNPAFTITLHEKRSFLVQAAMKELSTGKVYTNTLFRLQYEASKRGFTIHSYYKYRILDKSFVLKDDSRYFVYFRASDFSMCQHGRQFTVCYKKKVPGSQVAYFLAGADNRKIDAQDYSNDGRYTFSLQQVRFPVFIKVFVRFNGCSTARLLTRIVEDESGMPVIQNDYGVELLDSNPNT